MDLKPSSNLITKCLKAYKLKVLEWPSQSPNLTAIENLWADLKKQARAWRPQS